MKLSHSLAVLALSLLAVGCSSTGSKELPPLALQKIQQEVGLKTEWSRSVGVGQGKLWNNLTPAAEGDTLFVADAKGLVQSLDRFTGKSKWQTKLNQDISGAVGVGYGMVLLAALDGSIIALDSQTGEQHWISQVDSEVLSAPAINGDVVVVQTQDDRLIALDAYDGRQRWVYDNTPALLTLRGTSAPIITDQVVFAGLSTGKVIAVDTERGLPIWEQRVAIPSGRTELERMVDVDGDLLLNDGILYVASYQGRLAGLDAQSGQVLWQRDASSYVGLAEGYGNAYASLADGRVEAVDQRSSVVLWSNEDLLRRQLSAPATLASYIAVGDLEGYLHLLSQVDGRFVARTRVDSKGLRAQPLVVGDWIYAYGNGGKLVALTIK